MQRRRFFSLVARVSALIAGSRAWSGGAAKAAAPDGPAPLQAVLDEIIPAGGAMPSASAAGVAAYVERRRSGDAQFARALDAALEAVGRACREASGAPFASASREQRVAALLRLEASEGPVFAELRDATYEAYYTSPAVQKAVGYDFRTGAAPTASLPAFDQTRLARVRGQAPFFRKAEP